jgi:hypothetical protein
VTQWVNKYNDGVVEFILVILACIIKSRNTLFVCMCEERVTFVNCVFIRKHSLHVSLLYEN